MLAGEAAESERAARAIFGSSLLSILMLAAERLPAGDQLRPALDELLSFALIAPRVMVPALARIGVRVGPRML